LASVEVPLSVARNRRLPLVSVCSGRRADGYAPAGRPIGTIQVPLTQSEFDRLLMLRARQKSGMYGAAGFLVGALATARFSVLLFLGLTISLLSVAMWVVATLALMRLLPAAEVDHSRGSVALGRVHRKFVRAVEQADK